MSKMSERKESYKWIVLAISFALMLVFAVSLQMLPPLFTNITKEIPFSTKQAGILMSSYSVIGIFIPFLVAAALHRLDLKKTIITALSIVVLGLLGFSLSSTYPLLLMCRLLAGTGATILVVLSPLLITMFFDKSNIGSAMGIFNIAVPVGTVVSVNLFGYLGVRMNWRTIIVGIIIFVMITLAMVSVFLVLPSEKAKQDVRSSKPRFKPGLSLIFLGIIWMVANGQLLAYTTFGPQFFQLSGLSIQKASLLTSMAMLVSIFITPLIGLMIDKTGQKKLFLFVGLVIMAMVLFVIASPVLSLTFLAVALGLGFAFLPVSIFSLLPDVVKAEHTGMGLATITAASNLGIALGPAGFGSLLDMTSENYAIGFRVLSVFSLVCILILFGIKVKKSKGVKN